MLFRRAVGTIATACALIDECNVNRRGVPRHENWRDYSASNMRTATATGTSDAQAVHDFTPDATIRGFKALAEARLAVQAGRAVGTSIVVSPDTDHRFFNRMNEWATNGRASGLNDALLIDTRRQGGLEPAKLPANITF